VYLIEKWAEDHNLKLDQCTFVVQGFGNVGSWTARLLQARGARMVAVEDVTGAIANPDGIDPDSLVRYVQAHGGLHGYRDGKLVPHDVFMATEADLFIPAAMEHQITAATAPHMRVRLVAEGANGPTDPQGDQILQSRGIDVLPDILCNAGGVIVSYFEWLQNKRSEFWDLEEVDDKLHKKMVKAYERVREVAREREVDWRTAAYIVALSRLQSVYRERGIFP